MAPVILFPETINSEEGFEIPGRVVQLETRDCEEIHALLKDSDAWLAL